MTDRQRPPRVLFVHDDNPNHLLSSFLVNDIEALRKRFSVEVISLQPYRRAHLDAFLSLDVWRAVVRCDVAFVWFGTNAPCVIMASVLGKPTVVIAGGGDVAYVPEIEYGLNPDSKIVYNLVLLGYRLARKTLLFSHASLRDFLRLPGTTAARAEALHLGVDADHFQPAGSKLPQVLSVSYITRMSIRRKGLLTLLEAARQTPAISYRIAGFVVQEAAVQQILDAAPPNVTFLGHLDDNRLLQELQAAKVYAQLSYHEGFGMAVAEAMGCACIPVVTDRGSLPEVVGDTGFYVPVEDPAAAAEAFRAALSADDSRGLRARQRVVDLFKPLAREQALHAVIEEMLAS